MRHRSEGSSALKADRRYTYRDYRTWPDDERWELMDGTAYAMSPAPRREHQGLAGLIYRSIMEHLSSRDCKSYIAPIDVFFLQENEDLDDAVFVVQPDVVVVCDPAKLIPEGIKGAPDLVVEVISPSTAMRDQTEKREIYERGGVREYWIANPMTLEVLVYARSAGSAGDGGYDLPIPARLPDGVQSRIFPGLTVRVTKEEL